MSKLVDKERLARLAKALDDRMKAAVEAEKSRAVGVETGLNTRVTALENKFEGEGSVTALIAQAKQEAIDAAAADATSKDETLHTTISAEIDADVKVVADDLADEIERAKAEEVDIRADFAAADEELANRIKVFEAGGEQDVAAFKAAQVTKDEGQDDRIQALEDANKEGGAVANAIKAAKDAADDADAKAEAAQADADTLKQRLDAEGGLVDKIEANEDAIGVLNGDENKEGSVKKQIKDAIDEVNGAAVELEERVGDLENEVDNMKDASIDGSLAKQIADEVAAREAADEAIEIAYAAADAAEVTRVNKKIADDIAAESALRVAEEQRIEQALEDAIAKEVEDRDAAILVEKNRAEGQEAAIRGEFATADATLKAALQKEIDDDVKVVQDELDKQKDAAQEGTLAHQIKVEKERMDAFLKDADVQQGAIDTLKELQEYIDTHGEAAQKMVDDISTNAEAIAKLNGVDTVEGSVAYAVKVEADRAKAAEKVNADAITALDERIGDLEEVTSAEGILAQAKKYAEDQDAALKAELQDEIDDDVAAEATLRENADKALDERIKVFEANGAQDVAAKEVRLAAAEGEIDDLQEFVEGHDHSVMEQGIADNAAAIEAEVKKGGARDVAIAAALEDYSTTEEVKQILTNVVATLSLTMENNKMMLKLGGAEGVTLAEQSLDMATDADIDGIIAGLDTPAGE